MHQNVIIITWVFTYPDTLYISPKKAEIRELFPAPTDPTTATKEPLFIFKVKLSNVLGPSLLVQEKVAFSITSGSTMKKEVNILGTKS